MRIQENLEKSKYEADGKISIQGTTIPYHTICEDHFFVDEENNPVASIFSYAYFRSDIQDNSKRPILFIMEVQDVQVFGFTWDYLVLEL